MYLNTTLKKKKEMKNSFKFEIQVQLRFQNFKIKN